MRVVPGGPDKARQLMREHAQRQAALLVPRPGCPIYGLAAPELGPAQVTEWSSANGHWTSVTLSYGPEPGPRVTVTTTSHGEFASASHGSGEREPDAERERDMEDVTVLVRAWGVAMDDVRTAPVPDLRPLIEAAAEARIADLERRLREPKPPPPPPPDLPPAEGVDALRALADFTLAWHREIRAARAGDPGQRPRRGPEWGPVHNALWRRAAAERQRLGPVSAEQADLDVMSAVNHLGHLDEQAPWFGSDARLREAALDETLRYAMLDAAVASAAAQRAWADYWSAHLTGFGEPETDEGIRARFASRQTLLDRWLTAWNDWADQQG